jgi:hypothetical protein
MIYRQISAHIHVHQYMNREEKSYGKEEKRLIYMYTSTSKIQVTKIWQKISPWCQAHRQHESNTTEHVLKFYTDTLKIELLSSEVSQNIPGNYWSSTTDSQIHLLPIPELENIGISTLQRRNKRKNAHLHSSILLWSVPFFTRRAGGASFPLHSTAVSVVQATGYRQ